MLLYGKNKTVEGAIHELKKLVMATEHLETPIFPRDIYTVIIIVNITLNQLFVDLESNMTGVSLNKVSIHDI